MVILEHQNTQVDSLSDVDLVHLILIQGLVWFIRFSHFIEMEE